MDGKTKKLCNKLKRDYRYVHSYVLTKNGDVYLVGKDRIFKVIYDWNVEPRREKAIINSDVVQRIKEGKVISAHIVRNRNALAALIYANLYKDNYGRREMIKGSWEDGAYLSNMRRLAKTIDAANNNQ
jgi:hypothetical protein